MADTIGQLFSWPCTVHFEWRLDPIFQPWDPIEMTDTYTLVERNPYYNWVDTEGQQLPYIDRILSTKATDADAANVMILSGEIDVVLDDFARLPDMPLYLEGAERAGYYVQTSGGFTSPPLLYINHDYDYENPDSQWQVLVQDPERRFGRAVALAIDKHDINESLYFGLVTPIDYDPELANQLLDELGMTGRDAIWDLVTPIDYDPELANQLLDDWG